MPDLILDAAAPPPTRRRRLKDGRVVIERIPRTAQDPKRPHVKFKRWITMLDKYGNDVFCTMTTAAAEVMPEGKYANDMWRKFKKEGWFRYDRCPVALVQGGELHPKHLRVELGPDERPCPPGKHSDVDPCPHTIAEQEARREWNAGKEKARAEAWKSSELKQAEEQTKALMALAEKQAGGDANNDVLKAIQAQTAAIMALVEAQAGGGKRSK